MSTAKKESQFSKWAMCFVVVDFDVDIGPEIQLVYPNVPLSQQDQKKICFSAFPERSVSTSSIHIFRFIQQSSKHVVHVTCLYNCNKDATCKRGYKQSSLLLLSLHNYPNLFRQWLHVISILNKQEQNLSDILKRAVYEIDTKWPDPPCFNGPNCFHVELLDTQFHIDIDDQHQDTNTRQQQQQHKQKIILNSPFGSWKDIIPLLKNIHDIYTMYEMLILNKPFAVHADSPTITSSAISCLSYLINPLQLDSLKIEEYATLFDFSNGDDDDDDGNNNKLLLIGFTNPRLISNNLYVFKLGGRKFQSSSDDEEDEEDDDDDSSVDESELKPSSVDIEKTKKKKKKPKKSTSGDFIKSRRSHSFRIEQGKKNMKKPTTMLVKDRKFLQLIEKKSKDIDIDKIIIDHFNNLTMRILTPVNYYLHNSTTTTSEFNIHDFISFIQKACKGNNLNLLSTNNNNKRHKWEWKIIHYNSNNNNPLLGISSQRLLISPDSYPRKIFYSRLAQSQSFLSLIENS